MQQGSPPAIGTAYQAALSDYSKSPEWPWLTIVSRIHFTGRSVVCYSISTLFFGSPYSMTLRNAGRIFRREDVDRGIKNLRHARRAFKILQSCTTFK